MTGGRTLYEDKSSRQQSCQSALTISKKATITAKSLGRTFITSGLFSVQIQGRVLRKIKRSPKVSNYVIEGTQHKAYMKKLDYLVTQRQKLCGYQRPSRGVDPRDTHGQPAGMVGDLLENLAREPGAFAFWGKHPRDHIHGICRWSRSIMVSGNSSQHQARPIVDGSAFRRVIFH